MTERHALLLGATGLIGRHVLGLLLSDPLWARVTVLARKSPPISSPKLDWRVVRFDDESSWLSHTAVDTVLNCMGTTIKQAGSREAFRNADLEVPLAVIRAARARGATHAAAISALGADERSSVFYSRVKGELETKLSELGLVSLHLLRPSLLVGRRESPRAGERIAEVGLGLLKPLLVGRLRPYRAIAAADVAVAMVKLSVAPTSGVRIILSDEIAEVAQRSSEAV